MGCFLLTCGVAGWQDDSGRAGGELLGDCSETVWLMRPGTPRNAQGKLRESTGTVVTVLADVGKETRSQEVEVMMDEAEVTPGRM